MDNYAQIRQNVKDMVYHELDAISSQELSFDCLPIICQLVKIAKEIEETGEKEMENIANMEGYSRDGGYSNRSRMMPRYYDGNSYGNGYSMNGTYNRGGMSRNFSGGYSRDDGREKWINDLEKLMSETHDEHIKESIRRMINEAK